MVLYVIQNKKSCLWCFMWSETRRVVYGVVRVPKQGELFMVCYDISSGSFRFFIFSKSPLNGSFLGHIGLLRLRNSYAAGLRNSYAAGLQNSYAAGLRD